MYFRTIPKRFICIFIAICYIVEAAVCSAQTVNHPNTSNDTLQVPSFFQRDKTDSGEPDLANITVLNTEFKATLEVIKNMYKGDTLFEKLRYCRWRLDPTLSGKELYIDFDNQKPEGDYILIPCAQEKDNKRIRWNAYVAEDGKILWRRVDHLPEITSTKAKDEVDTIPDTRLMGLEKFVVVAFEEEATKEIDQRFSKYFQRATDDYLKMFYDKKIFSKEVNDFLRENEDTKWLSDFKREKLFDHMYNKFKIIKSFEDVKLDDKKKEFYYDMLWLVELGRNIRIVLETQVDYALDASKMNDLKNNNVSFTYEKSHHPMNYRKEKKTGKDILLVNLKVYNRDNRAGGLSSLRFSILYRLMAYYQLTRFKKHPPITYQFGSLGRSKSEDKNIASIEDIGIRDKYLYGFAFDRSILRDIDKKDYDRYHQLMGRIISEWSAYMLSFAPDIRREAIKRRLKEAYVRLSQEKNIKKIILELAARAAVVECAEYDGKNDEIFQKLMHMISDEDDRIYFEDLKNEFQYYINSLCLRYGMNMKESTQGEFDDYIPSLKGKDFYYSRKGKAHIVISKEIDGINEAVDNTHIEAFKAKGSMLNDFYHRMNDTPKAFNRVMAEIKGDENINNALDVTLKSLGADDPAKRRTDILEGEHGQFNNADLEKMRRFDWKGRAETIPFYTPPEIKKLIDDYFKKLPTDTDGSGKPMNKAAAFIFRSLPGGVSMFQIFDPRPKDKDDRITDIQYTLRGGIEKDADGNYMFFFQGQDIRDPVEFMVQYGWSRDILKNESFNKYFTKVILNEMITASRTFLEGGFSAKSLTNFAYTGVDGKAEHEWFRTLRQLANCSIDREYWYPPINDPDYVPQSFAGVVAEMMAFYNYYKYLLISGIKLTREGSDLVNAVEKLQSYSALLKAFPLYGIKPRSHTKDGAIESIKHVFYRNLPNLMHNYAMIESLSKPEINIIRNAILDLRKFHFTTMGLRHFLVAPWFKNGLTDALMMVFDHELLNLKKTDFDRGENDKEYSEKLDKLLAISRSSAQLRGEPIKASVGTKICKIREEILGISQKEFADKLGVTESEIISLEAPNRLRVRRSIQIKLAHILGVNKCTVHGALYSVEGIIKRNRSDMTGNFPAMRDLGATGITHSIGDIGNNEHHLSDVPSPGMEPISDNASKLLRHKMDMDELFEKVEKTSTPTTRRFLSGNPETVKEDKPRNRASDALPIEIVRPDDLFMRNIEDPRELVTNLIETLISLALSQEQGIPESKHIYLAFHNDIRCLKPDRINEIISALEHLKGKPGFKSVLKNVEILPRFRKSADLERYFSGKGIDPNNTAINAIFTFIPSVTHNELTGLRGSYNKVLIDEGEFNASLYYYPLTEIVTLTLIKHLKGLSKDDMNMRLNDLGVDINEFSINKIDELSDNTLIFVLLPGMDVIESEALRIRNKLIKEQIDSAA